MSTISEDSDRKNGISNNTNGGGSYNRTHTSDPSWSSQGSSSIWDKPIQVETPMSRMGRPAGIMSSATTTTYDTNLLMTPILKRYPSFVPLVRHATSIAEVTFLVPAVNSSLREATIMSATFNMTATIIGGGVLSIPLSCARAGIIPFTVLMIISALMTDFSLYILCSCARRTGSTSYGVVARKAVNTSFELFTIFIITFLLIFTVTGLMVLNMGIWSPIIISLLFSNNTNDDDDIVSPSSLSSAETDITVSTTTFVQDATVLFACLVIMIPFLLKKNLTSLRHICYVGFFSITILCIAMSYRAFEKNAYIPGMFTSNIKWFATNISDVMTAMPIILQAFLCSFNMISVHCALVEPTRDRVIQVIHLAVLLSFVIMYIFGVAGYLWAYDKTNGNILLNFDPTDKVIFVGRIGCGITTLFALPMNVLPCREALISLSSQMSELIFSKGRRRSVITKEEQKHLLKLRASANNAFATDTESETSGSSESSGSRHSHKNTDRILLLKHTRTSPTDAFDDEEQTYGSITSNNALPPAVPSSPLLKNAKITTIALTDGSSSSSNNSNKMLSSSNNQHDHHQNEQEIIHISTTFVITICCYVAAILVPGVAIVWDFSGSSMAFLLQFIIPAICYIPLKMEARPKGAPPSKRMIYAWALLIITSLASLVCTLLVIRRYI